MTGLINAKCKDTDFCSLEVSLLRLYLGDELTKYEEFTKIFLPFRLQSSVLTILLWVIEMLSQKAGKIQGFIRAESSLFSA